MNNSILVCADNPTYFAKVGPHGSLYTRFHDGNPELNAFSAINIAEKYLLGEYRFPYDKMPIQFQDQVIAAGALVYDSAASSIVMSVGTGATDSIIRTSYRYHTYTSGQSHRIRISTSGSDNGKVGVTRRWGYFDLSDGLYFEIKDSVLNVVMRSSSTGSIVETRIPRSQWNFDQLTGMNNSMLDLDLTKANTFWIEFQWYGTGRARMGVLGADGSRITCHEFRNTNKNSRPYMATPTLPVRYELVNTVVTDSVSSMRVIATTVETDGEPPFSKSLISINSPAPTAVNSSEESTLFVIGLQNLYNGKVNRVGIQGNEMSVYVKGTAPVYITFYLGFGMSAYTGVTLTNHTNPMSSSMVGYNGSIAKNASNSAFFSQICQPGVNSIDYKSFIQDLRAEMRRSPDNTFSMMQGCTAKCVFSGDTADVAFTLTWKEIK